MPQVVRSIQGRAVVKACHALDPGAAPLYDTNICEVKYDYQNLDKSPTDILWLIVNRYVLTL